MNINKQIKRSLKNLEKAISFFDNGYLSEDEYTYFKKAIICGLIAPPIPLNIEKTSSESTNKTVVLSRKELRAIIVEKIQEEGPKCDLNDIDTSRITDMSFLFANPPENTRFVTGLEGDDIAARFRGDISSWDVSNVTNMEGMFCNAKDFNSSIKEWNVSNVTNFSAMFAWATNFNQPINTWNVSKGKDMSGMFYNAEAFNQPIGGGGTFPKLQIC